MLKNLGRIILSFCLFVFWLWCSLAVYFICLPFTDLAMLVAGGFVLVIPVLFFLLPWRNIALLSIFLLYAAVIIGWNNMQPSNDRDWLPGVARLPYVSTDSALVTVHNVRNFDYQAEHEFVKNYYTKTYDLDELESLSFMLSYWDEGTVVAHTILSFGFANGDYLAVSAETRVEEGESQALLQGFFNQYEMIYILADERDIIRLRTNFRKEEVFLYPTRVSKQNVRKVFDAVIARVNKLYQSPEFYNTLSQNCFTSLRTDLSVIVPAEIRFDWRVLANGYADRMLYENNWIDTDLSFIAAKRYFHINQYVSGGKSADGFSMKIRPWLSN